GPDRARRAPPPALRRAGRCPPRPTPYAAAGRGPAGGVRATRRVEGWRPEQSPEDAPEEDAPEGATAMATRSAHTSWTGGLQDGTGTVSLTSSKAASFDVSFPRRTADDAQGVTSPEELIAAA